MHDAAGSPAFAILRGMGTELVSPPAAAELETTTPAGELAYRTWLAPGASLPSHEHLAAEECLVLDSELWPDESLMISTGDYHFAPAGLGHNVARPDTGALFFLRSDRPAYG